MIASLQATPRLGQFVRVSMRCCVMAFMLLSVMAAAQQEDGGARAWMTQVRIGAYSLSSKDAAKIPDMASASGVFGIEVDNDIPGRYESFLHPKAKLQAIRTVAAAAHRSGNRAFVYVAGLECITADADHAQHTMAKDHPDWLQRKRSGEPAIFTSGAAFWIRKGDEDVWVSPYAPEWRKIYMERIRQIAATGIDGIYVDIPYWMTHFTGWEDSWASFDPYTVKAFRERTGLDAMKDFKLGDFNDPNFLRWVDFRIASITELVAEIRENATSVNPDIAVIPEIYPGIEESAVRVGADVYQLYPVVDAIAHEYEYGNSEDHAAASRGEFDWFLYQIGMQSFRAFAEGKPTWILNYSWDGNPRVSRDDAMKNLAMSEVIAGANFWDAPGHSMAGSNDLEMRKQIFKWIADNERHLFAPRVPVGQVGVYFSEATRNHDPEEFVSSYQGVLLLLLQKHIQFQIVTPRSLGRFHGKVLVLPDTRLVDDAELKELKAFCARHGVVVSNGAANRRIATLPSVTAFPDDPGARYLAEAKKDLTKAAVDAPMGFLRAIDIAGPYAVEASPHMVVYVAKVDGRTHWYLANFKGLLPGNATKPVPERNVVLYAPVSSGSILHMAPFLGAAMIVHGTVSEHGMRFVIPEVDRGAVAWTDTEDQRRAPLKLPGVSRAASKS